MYIRQPAVDSAVGQGATRYPTVSHCEDWGLAVEPAPDRALCSSKQRGGEWGALSVSGKRVLGRGCQAESQAQEGLRTEIMDLEYSKLRQSAACGWRKLRLQPLIWVVMARSAFQ